ncbi:MAG: hypothetical protein R2882_04195 [Gemmatimonadales bacterium]
MAMLAACKGDSLGPARAGGPPYLAVVAKIESGTIADPSLKFEYRIRDVSEGGTLDTTIAVSPADTVILSVRPASYQIDLLELPPKCVSRYGPIDVVVVPEGINTALSRFFITCNAPLAVTVYTAGGPDTVQFVWELTNEAGVQQTGFIRNKLETLIFNPLTPGAYAFSIWNMPSNCEVITPGRRTQQVMVSADGGDLLQFSVTCSDPEHRPVIGSFTWSFHDSAAVFRADVSDPDRDLIGYYFDITDCEGHSVRPGGEIERGGLNTGRTAFAASTTIIGGYEYVQLGMGDAQLAGHCASLRVVDASGNTTPPVERPVLRDPGVPPVATDYNAFFIGTSRLATRLSVVDADGDFFGVFVLAELRDGVLRGQDGETDIGIYNTQGYDNTLVPDLPLGGRITTADVYAQIVYLVDDKGHFRRIVDRDPFQ